MTYEDRPLGAALWGVDSVDVRWDLSICISNKFLGNVDAAGPGPTFSDPLPWVLTSKHW